MPLTDHGSIQLSARIYLRGKSSMRNNIFFEIHLCFKQYLQKTKVIATKFPLTERAGSPNKLNLWGMLTSYNLLPNSTNQYCNLRTSFSYILPHRRVFIALSKKVLNRPREEMNTWGPHHRGVREIRGLQERKKKNSLADLHYCAHFKHI